MKKHATVAAYLASVPPAARRHLRALRAAAKAVAPDAAERISYGMPALVQDGVIVWYAAFKDHVSLFPRPAAIAKFKRELARYKVSKGTIQFPLDEPLPLALIRKIVRFRVAAMRGTRRARRRSH